MQRQQAVSRAIRPLFAAAAVAVGLSAGTAVAQTSQQAAPRTGPAAHSPFWGGESRGYGHSGGYDGGYGREDGFSEAFPVDLAARVAPAHADYIAMKWGYRTARSNLHQRVHALRAEFERSEAYQQLQQDIRQAAADLQAAKDEAYAPLRQNEEYVASGEIIADLEARISELHQSRNPDDEEIRGLSELVLSHAQRRHEMEISLAADTSAIDEAREQLRGLGEEQAQLEAQFQQQLRDDEQVAQMKDQLDQLRIAWLASGAFYESAVRTANIAGTFAYTRQYLQSPWYGRYGGYYPYGYGYGHGYGYPFAWNGGLIIAGPGVGGLGPRDIQLQGVGPRHTMGPGGPRHTMGTTGGVSNTGAPVLPPEAFE